MGKSTAMDLDDDVELLQYRNDLFIVEYSTISVLDYKGDLMFARSQTW